MRTDAPNIYRDADLGGGHEVSTVARALELVAENAGLSGSGVAAGARPVTAEDAWQAVANYSATASWTEIAASAARALGLQPYLCEDSLGFDPGELPALARVGEGQWLVVIGRRGRRLTVVQLDERGERRVRLTPTQLRALVGRQPWLLMRPLLALDPIGVARRPVLKDRTWLRLRAFLGLERRELWVVVIYAIVLGGLTLATPIAAQALVNTVAFGAVLQPLVVLTILLLAGLGFAGALGVLEGYVVEVVQRRVFVRIADDFGRRLPSVRGDALDGRYGPELVNRFFDVLTIQKSLAVLLLDGMTLALQTGIGMILLGFYHPLLLAFDFVLIVLLALVLALGRGAVATGLHESSAKYKTAAWLEDLIRAPHLFRGARAQEYAARRTEALCRDYLSARKRHYRLLVRQIAGGYGLQITAMVTLLGVGGWLVIDRQLTLGQLVAAELVIAAIGASFVKLGNNLEKLYDLNVGVLKVASVVDLPTERRGGEPLAPGGPARVVLRDVDVARGGRALVRGASLELEPGARLRLRGPAGGGKSTLLDVLAGLRPQARGSVQVDGLDLRRADLASARQELVVARGADFVDGSVLDNLRLMARDCGKEASVRALLRLTQLERVVDGLPQGLETRMTPAGAPLSSSQARRLALARALAARPRVLLLDGALDGLGLEEDERDALLDAVLGPGAPWTVVVVTEDPAVAARCDRVATLRDGELEVA